MQSVMGTRAECLYYWQLLLQYQHAPLLLKERQFANVGQTRQTVGATLNLVPHIAMHARSLLFPNRKAWKFTHTCIAFRECFNVD